MLDYHDQFMCVVCSATAEHRFSVKTLRDVPDEVACPSCGGVAKPIEHDFRDVEVLVMGREFDVNKPCHTPNWEKGVTRDQYEAACKADQVQTRKLVQQRARDTGKKPMRLLAKIPVGVFKARTNEFGKQYWIDEGKKAMKRDGLYLQKD